MRICFIFLTILICATSRAADVPATQPVVYQHIVRKDPPMHLHWVTVDLTNPSVHLKVSRGGNDAKLTAPWETTLMPLSGMAKRDSLFVAVNGNYFIPKDSVMAMGKKVPYFPGNWARTCGFAMADGALFSREPASPHYPCFIVSADGTISIKRIENIPADAKQIVAGMMEIVTDGKNAAGDNAKPDQPAPRTAIGFDRDHKKLVMLVVDGRRLEYSAGMTRSQMAEEMIKQNCWQAIDLDGGGSSTMVMRDKAGDVQVMNKPSDGWNLPVDMSIERSIAVGVGLVIDGQPTTKP